MRATIPSHIQGFETVIIYDGSLCQGATDLFPSQEGVVGSGPGALPCPEDLGFEWEDVFGAIGLALTEHFPLLGLSPLRIGAHWGLSLILQLSASL